MVLMGCADGPEFTIPEPQNNIEPKLNKVIILEDDFEEGLDSWKYVPSHNRSENKFAGEWTNDAAYEGARALKIQRLLVTEESTEGYYDYASWKKSITDFEVPFNADLTFLGKLRLENIRGTGISLRINLKRKGVQVAFAESGWINGNGSIIDWQSYGCLFEGAIINFDEIELELRMEPVTGGTVYFDDVTLQVSY